jgi:glycerate 2-kinase
MLINSADFLHSLFAAAVAAVSPEKTLPAYLPQAPKGRTLILGGGKAAASMAKAVEDHWKTDLSGLVVTRYGHDVPLRHVEVVQSGHPMPDDNGENAARRMLQMASTLEKDDLLLCLISGGASALMGCPAPGLTMADLRAVNKGLLHCGAPIDEMNCVRKHLSAIAGGRLAAATKARVVTLLVSDVPGDDPATIGSGPTVADPTTFADAYGILKKYGFDLPAAVIRHMEAAAEESLKPGDVRLKDNEVHIIATPQHALDAAAEAARNAGVTPVILGHRIEGEAREVGKVMAGIALHLADENQPAPAPCVLLSGGETTVTMKGNKGRGGRNSEFLLSLAIALKGHPRISALAADTDGIDGSEENAGAYMLPDTLSYAQSLGVNPYDLLDANDAYGFFDSVNTLITTGPTRTNVNDFRAVLVSGKK